MDRLTNTFIWSTEHKYTKKINLGQVIEKSVESKTRKQNFTTHCGN